MIGRVHQMVGRVLMAMVLAWLCLASSALAHEIRPAYLQIDATDSGSYDVVWKVPSRGGTVLDIQPQFDPAFTLTETGEVALLEGFAVYLYRLSGEKELPGTEIAIVNLPQTRVDVLANVNLPDGTKHTFLMHPKRNTATIPQSASKWSVAATYARLGIEHILLGFDHLLFVLALIFLTKGFGRIVKTVTAFTVAHSITLSLAALGYVHVPGPPVEATIALSIMFLAVEILRALDGKETLTGRKPWLVAFTFGLLHGLGFAGALSRIGLPQMEIPLALASFNIGVELGQIAFVAVVFLGIITLERTLDVQRAWPIAARKAPAYAIGAVSAFWLIDRLSGFTA
jgi:hydrogenase/urease accessory protein HupE